MYRKCKWMILELLLCLCCLAGCDAEKKTPQKLAEVEYVVVEDAMLPEKLKMQINERKAEPFQMTYEDGEYRYIVKGYGEQKTGGYSIRIKECYLTEDAIYFDAELVGPRKGEEVNRKPSYPYVVIQTEKRDESTVFE